MRYINLKIKETKKIEDSINQYTQMGRDDLVSKEKSDLEIINTYLPELMNDDDEIYGTNLADEWIGQSAVDIFYNENAFKEGFHKFNEISGKEKWLSNAAKKGKLPESWTNGEILSYKHLYKNYGLISPANSQKEIYLKSMNYLVDPRTGISDMTYYYEMSNWDWIYKIPRRY